MAWYDKLRDEGIIVKGTVLEKENSFYQDRECAIEDVYIQCGGNHAGDQIFCYTASVPYLRKHTYDCCIYSYGRGMNTLRNYYRKHIGEEKDITRYVKEKGKDVKKWLNEKMIKEIEKEGVLFGINECDGELYFKSKDIEVLKDIMEIRTIEGKSKDPFSEDYYNWENYEIPEKDMQKYNDAKFAKYGKLEFGRKETLAAALEIKDITNNFLAKNKINLAKRRSIKIKDNKCAIHKLGLWNKFIKEFR